MKGSVNEENEEDKKNEKGKESYKRSLTLSIS